MARVTEKSYERQQPIRVEKATPVEVLALLKMSFSPKIWRRSLSYINGSSAYKQKDELTWALSRLLHIFQSSSSSQKVALQENLKNAFKQKTPEALHIHVNAVLFAQEFPKTIPVFLNWIRVEIVKSVINTRDWSEWNSFFIGAADYGVNPFHQNDPYSRKLNKQERESLQNAFNSKYTARNILDLLFNGVRYGVKESCAYTGEKVEGYSADSCNSIKKFFEDLLENSSLQYNELFQSSGDVTTDINWSFVHNAICSKLQDDGYLSFSEAEQRLLKILYAPAPADVSLDVLKEFVSIDSELKNDVFIFYPELLELLPGTKADKTPAVTLTHLNHLLRLAGNYPQSVSENIHNAWVAKNTMRLSAISDEPAEVQREMLAGLLLFKPAKLAELFNGMANKNDLLNLAARYKPSLLRLLLKIMSSNGINDFQSPLLKLIEYHPEDVPSILAGIAKLAIPIQARFLNDKRLIDVALKSRPNVLASVLGAITHLPDIEQREVMEQQECSHPFLAKTVARYASQLPVFLKGMRNFIPSIQERLWTELTSAFISDVGDAPVNALILALATNTPAESALLPLLREMEHLRENLASDKLAEEVLGALWLLKGAPSDTKMYNPLMLATRREPESLEVVLRHIAWLPADIQNRLWTATGGPQDDNILGFLTLDPLSRRDVIVKPILEMVGLLNSSTQNQLWNHRNSKGLQPLQLFANFPGASCRKLAMEHVRLSGFVSQMSFFQGHPHLDIAKQLAIPAAWNSLSTDSKHPLEAEIRRLLDSMYVFTERKMVDVLLALDEIKKTKINTEAAIHDAIFDSTSPLCRALNSRRYNIPFFTETDMVVALRKLASRLAKEDSVSVPLQEMSLVSLGQRG